MFLSIAIALGGCKDYFTDYHTNETAAIKLEFVVIDYELYLKGTITNKMDFDIKDVMVYYDGDSSNVNEFYSYCDGKRSVDSDEIEGDSVFYLHIGNDDVNLNTGYYSTSKKYVRAYININDIGYVSECLTFTADLIPEIPRPTVPCANDLTRGYFENDGNSYSSSYYSSSYTTSYSYNTSGYLYYYTINFSSYISCYDMKFVFNGEPKNGTYTTVSTESELETTPNSVYVYIYPTYYSEYAADAGQKVYVVNDYPDKYMSFCPMSFNSYSSSYEIMGWFNF